MKFRYICGAALVLGATAVALADGTGDLTNFLRRLEPQVSKAFAKEDLAFFQNISTPEFTYVDHTGKSENKTQSMASLKQMFAMSSNIKAKFTRGAVSVKGNLGTARYKGHYSMDVQGPDGKKAKMSMESMTLETFKKVGNKWLVHQIKETSAGKMMMNGKPFNPGPPPPVAKPPSKSGS